MNERKREKKETEDTKVRAENRTPELHDQQI